MVWFVNNRLRGAIVEGNLPKLEQLLEGKKNLEADLETGATPLQYAVMKRREDVVAFLIEKGANVNASNSDGWTPLHRAAFLGQVGITALLLKAGADPNLRDRYGKTVYGFALSRGEAEIAELVKPYIKKEDFGLTLPPAPPETKTEEEAPKMGAGWTYLGEQQVARVLTNSALGYKLTDVFDFAARERIRIVNNLETKRDQVETVSFDVIADKGILEAAFVALRAVGGTADHSAIAGGLHKAVKLQPPAKGAP